MTYGRPNSWFWLVLFALALPPASCSAPDTVWTYRYGPAVGGTYQPLASFVDDTGNVLVVGWQAVDTTALAVFVFKIDSLGQLRWQRTYDNMTAAGAVRDTSGNVYIAGVTRGTSTNRQICVLRYKPNGDRDWVKTYGEAGKNFFALGTIAIDDSQNVYACGAAESSSSCAVRVLRYRPNSTAVDTIRYALQGYDYLCDGQFHAIGNGQVYLALSAEHPERGNDWLVVKLSLDSQILWERAYRDTGGTFERLRWSLVDSEANIYLTGDVKTPSSQTRASYCTMKMDSLGVCRRTGLS